MKMIVWMGKTKGGEFLCYGNPNDGMSYHICFPHDHQYLANEPWILRRAKWAIEEDCRKWNKEVRAKSGFKKSRLAVCEPVKIEVTWKEVKEECV